MEDHVLKTYIDEHGILNSSVHGTVLHDRIPQLEKDIETAEALVQNEFEKRGSKKFRALIDLSDFTGTFDTHTLELVGGYMKKNKPYIEKTAGFGASRTATLAANVVSAMGGRDNISFFRTRDDALAWLLSD
jgi:hypothetical protein